jgi:glycosyltransferase involved in cell wall biosynthesis
VTEYAQNNFKNVFGKGLRSWVVHHSFNPTYFFPRNRLVSDVITVGFVGRLEPSKGVTQVFSISERLADLPFKFVIAGRGSLRANVEFEAVKSNGRLSYMGHLEADQLGELYRNIDFLLVPSIRSKDWEESFGMVIVEAMACGAVPIATNHPGPSEILTGELATNIFTEENIQEGAVSILLRARSEPEYLERLKVAAKQLSNGYTISAISNKWLPITYRS